MDKVYIIIAMVCAIAISIIFLQKPLEQREVYGAKSVLIRLVVGIVAGLIIGFLITMQ